MTLNSIQLRDESIELLTNEPVIVVANSVETGRKSKFFQMALSVTMKTHDQLAIVVVELTPARLAVHFGYQKFGSIDSDRFVLSATATSNW